MFLTHFLGVGELEALLVEGCEQSVGEVHREVVLHQLVHHRVHGRLLRRPRLRHALQQQRVVQLQQPQQQNVNVIGTHDQVLKILSLRNM